VLRWTSEVLHTVCRQNSHCGVIFKLIIQYVRFLERAFSQPFLQIFRRIETLLGLVVVIINILLNYRITVYIYYTANVKYAHFMNWPKINYQYLYILTSLQLYN